MYKGERFVESYFYCHFSHSYDLCIQLIIFVYINYVYIHHESFLVFNDNDMFWIYLFTDSYLLTQLIKTDTRD